MKTILAAAFLVFSAPAWAQSSAFTYQGELEQSGSPVTGEFDFEFALFDDSLGGTQVAGPFTVEDVFVDGGLFEAEVDFGANVFGGGDRWLEIRVRPGSSTDAFTIMTPRQKITPTPLALNARSVALQAIDTPQLALHAVTGDRIATDAVTNRGLAPDSVGSPEVVDNSVTGDDIAGSAIGSSEIDSNQVQLRVGEGCSAGSSIREILADGTVVCEIDDESEGDITGVVAGFGLSGGADSGQAQLEADPLDVQVRVNDACNSGDAIRQIHSDGTVECQPIPHNSRQFIAPTEFRPRSYMPATSDRHPPDQLSVDYLAGQAVVFGAAPFPEPPLTRSLIADLDLPQGAEVTQVECFIRDNDPDSSFTPNTFVSLDRITPGSDDRARLVDLILNSTGVTGHASFSESTIDHAIIDNNGFHYVVKIDVVIDARPDFFDPQFRGCRIDYELPAEPASQ